MLRSIRVVDIDLGDGTTKRAVTAPTPRAAAVLRAIGISDLDPPTPPNHDVVTKQKSTPTKSKSYSRKRETWASLPPCLIGMEACVGAFT
jgi:hypothetical protein